jgi:tricarballylate dehydrogenase
MTDKTVTADVIVVGCGVAGLSAAVAAQQSGASVAVIERAPLSERGGNTRYTGAWLRMKSEDEISEDFIDHFIQNGGAPIDPALIHLASERSENWPSILRAMSFVDPEVIATLAEEAAPTLKWLKTLGVRFARLEVPFLTSVQPRTVPSGGGLALIEALAAEFERLGGRIDYEIAAQSLLQDDSGNVTGVRCVGNGNRVREFRGKAVVLACGGFQGNAEMMARYIGPRSVHLGMMSRGCHYNKGEGIRMALDIGAASCGDFGKWHASPMDPRSSRAGASVYIYPYGVLLNKLGQRFTDEAPGPTDETYENVARTISSQPDGIAYAIVDSVAGDLPHMQAAYRSEVPPAEAATLPELAAKIGLPVDAVTATISEYNSACGEGRFSPLELDGLKTNGLPIRKSNWASPIAKAPFKAYPIISSIVFTFGGLRVNSRAQVVNLQGDAIPGLYAAGETMGLYYGSYTGATSVLKGAVFGRLAGLDIARPQTNAA